MCKYRYCDKTPEPNEGKGRNRQFCNDKCKNMEQYYKRKDKENEQ